MRKIKVQLVHKIRNKRTASERHNSTSLGLTSVYWKSFFSSLGLGIRKSRPKVLDQYLVARFDFFQNFGICFRPIWF